MTNLFKHENLIIPLVFPNHLLFQLLSADADCRVQSAERVDVD